MKLIKFVAAVLILTGFDLTYGNDIISLDFISDVVETIHGYPFFEYLMNTDVAKILCRGGQLQSVPEIVEGVSTCKASQSIETCRMICLLQHIKMIKPSNELGIDLKDADATIERIFPSKVTSDLKLAIRMCEKKLGTVLGADKGCEDNKKFADCIHVVLVQVCDMRILPKPAALLGKAAGKHKQG